MSTIGERVRILRESTGLGRTRFAREVGIKEATLLTVEYDRSKPGFEILQKLVLKYPEHCYWLITGKVNSKLGQVKPTKPKRDDA